MTEKQPGIPSEPSQSQPKTLTPEYIAQLTEQFDLSENRIEILWEMYHDLEALKRFQTGIEINQAEPPSPKPKAKFWWKW